MARTYERSRLRPTTEEKKEVVRQLLERGLTVGQVTAQVNCGRNFVYRVLHAMEVAALSAEKN